MHGSEEQFCMGRMVKEQHFSNPDDELIVDPATLTSGKPYVKKHAMRFMSKSTSREQEIPNQLAQGWRSQQDEEWPRNQWIAIPPRTEAKLPGADQVCEPATSCRCAMPNAYICGWPKDKQCKPLTFRAVATALARGSSCLGSSFWTGIVNSRLPNQHDPLKITVNTCSLSDTQPNGHWSQPQVTVG